MLNPILNVLIIQSVKKGCKWRNRSQTKTHCRDNNLAQGFCSCWQTSTFRLHSHSKGSSKSSSTTSASKPGLGLPALLLALLCEEEEEVLWLSTLSRPSGWGSLCSWCCCFWCAPLPSWEPKLWYGPPSPEGYRSSSTAKLSSTPTS